MAHGYWAVFKVLSYYRKYRLITINFDREQMIRIVAGMSRVENGREVDISDVIAGWNLL